MKVYHLTLNISLSEVPLPAPDASEETTLDPVARDNEQFDPVKMLERLSKKLPQVFGGGGMQAVPAEARIHECYNFAAEDLETAVKVFKAFSELADKIAVRHAGPEPLGFSPGMIVPPAR